MRLVATVNEGSGSGATASDGSGSTVNEVKVEICISGSWSSVCGGIFWGLREARVTCRQLGFSCMYGHYCRFVMIYIKFADGVPVNVASSPTGRYRIFCNGDESDLHSCEYNNSCSSSGGDAGVKCNNGWLWLNMYP